MLTLHSQNITKLMPHASLSTDLDIGVKSHVRDMEGLELPTYAGRTHSASTPTVLSPNKKVEGVSQAEWADKWWQWVYSLPNNLDQGSVNPVYDNENVGTIAGEPIAQDGAVYNLVGSYNAEAIEGQGFVSKQVRGNFDDNPIYVRDDQYIFTPILNTQGDNGGAGGTWVPYGLPFETQFTEQELRRISNSLMKTAQGLFIEVDGDLLISEPKDWQKYRQTSPPKGFSYTPPDSNILYPPESYPGGVTVNNAVSDGYWVMLNPLSEGEHTIHFGGFYDLSNIDVDIDGNPKRKTWEEQKLDEYFGRGTGARFELDITYNITVVPGTVDISALAG